MRELKFRAWDKKGYRWVGHNIQIDGTGCLYWVFGYDCHIVGRDEYEIQQFTGLYDKNKKPIYEGDILQFLYCVQGKADGEKIGEKTIGAVQWRTCSFYLRYGYGGKELSGMDGNNEICWSEEWVRCSEPRGYYKLKGFEVIGNICEHSHLIKG